MSLPLSLPAIPAFWPVALALLAAGALGARRGWVRELALLGGVLLSWIAVIALGFGALGWVNRLALIVSFTWEGGFDAADPAPLLRVLRLTPPIDPWHPQTFYAALFAAGVVASYLFSSRVGTSTQTFADGALGALAGALNGYVISYVLLGQLQPPRSGGPLDSFGVLADNVPTLVVGAVVGVVAIALLASVMSGGLGSKRAGRANG